MSQDRHILHTGVTLMPGVPLNVYALRGSEYSVIVDTGIAAMRDGIVGLCRDAGNLRYALITHAHADHIGCNRAVREATGARFAAAGAFAWIEDLDLHYREFCLVDEASLPDSPQQRSEILGLMDGEVHCDIALSEGTRFRLGDDLELETITLPGHKSEEVAFLDRERGDLFMGDLLLALAAPFFHGFQTASGFNASLDRLAALIGNGVVRRVFPAHHPVLDREAALAAIADTRRFLDDVETATIAAATGLTFPDLWRAVCRALGKQLEFRGYAMLDVQVAELVDRGILALDGKRIVRK
ncbi:MAG TPA: MBL fold metallo-hydrolase [Devosia sp.]|nr:MBL fold metallo-hydrolase [Devosia sp.]